MTAPPIPYFGSKSAVAHRIVELLPSHKHYVEPFAGSLAVLLAKGRSQIETVNDLDGDVMHFWRMLRDRPEDLAHVCALTPHSRAEYGEAYEPAEDDLERARRIWVQLAQGRAGTLKRTGWRYTVDPGGRSGSIPTDLAAWVRRMTAAAARLAGVTLECQSALDVIRTYGASPNVLIYADPPYLGETRSGSYGTDLKTEDEHREIAEVLVGCRATVVLSGYPSPLYDELYRDWTRVELATATGQGSKWGSRTEVLWSNRPIGAPTLFDEAAS